MKIGGYVIIAVMAVACAALVFVTRWLETQYFQRHPPDDGTRVEHFDEEDQDDE